MRLADLKAALKPSLSDVDKLFAGFVAQEKSNDPYKFLEWLHTKGLISDALVEEIVAQDPGASGTLETATSEPKAEPKADAKPDAAAERPHPKAPPKSADPHDLRGLAGVTIMPDDDDLPLPSTSRDDDDSTPKPAPNRPAPYTPPPKKTPSVEKPPAAEKPPVAEKAGKPAGAPADAPAAEKADKPQPENRAPIPGPPPPPTDVKKSATPAPAPQRQGAQPPRTPSYPPKAPANKTAGTPGDLPGRGYQFIGKIGEGAMGEILIAKDRDLHRTVAFKVMADAIAENPVLSGKFYGEAQITAQLDHPNIVPVYALARANNGTLAYTMKLIHGRTFEKLVEETKNAYKARKVPDELQLTARLDMFLKVLDAMYYAHTRGVVHRDLKPENIMVGAFGEVYVMDWGIARLFEVSGARREDLVLVEGYQEDESTPKAPGAKDDDDEDDDDAGVIIGTPQYMSPEQAAGNKTLDGRSDQYALGLILFELVALKPAVTGKSPIKIVMRQQDAEKDPFVHAFGETIAPEIKAIVAKATAKKPEARYADVHAFAEDIRRYLRGEAVLARPDTPRQKVMRWVGRHRELTLFMVFVFFSMAGVTLMGSVAWSVYANAKARQHEQQLSGLVTSVGAQAAVIDSKFARFQGLLGIVAASTSEMLIRGEPVQQPVFWNESYASEDATKKPEDVEQSKKYDQPLSIAEPVYLKPADVSDSEATTSAQRLQPLQRYLKRVMLLSKDEQAASYTPKRAQRLISDVGVPFGWVTVGLTDGLGVVYPGHGGYPDKYDVRARPWYKLAENKREPTWGAPFVDDSGLGLLLPCATGLYDEDDKFLGVASVQIPFDYIISELLVTEGLPEGAESFLVDNEGRIVVRSSEKGKTFDKNAMRNRSIRMPDFPVPEVVQAIKDKESGSVPVTENGERDLVLYNRMASLGWYYIVRGEESKLLAE